MKFGGLGTTGSEFLALFEGGTTAGLSDGQLLDRFSGGRRDGSGEPAFAALVARHGPMVWGTCRRILRDRDAAEDAFQATFLILVRRAGSIHVGDSLGRWLHGVGVRVALRARTAEARRRDAVSLEVDPGVSEAEPGLDEVRSAIDEEVARLPSAYRSVVVLCLLEGLTRDRAATELGCPLGTVNSRLSRALELLRTRLTRRGFAPTVATLGALLSAEGASASVSLRLLKATIQVAKAGAVPAVVDLLAEGVIRTMILTKSKILAAAVVGCGLVVSSLCLRAQGPASPSAGAGAKSVETPKTVKGASPDGADETVKSLIEGLSKLGDLKDLGLSVQVSSGEAALEKLDPATRALVDAALKGVDIKALKGNAEVVQKDGKTMIIVPGKVTIEERSPSSSPSLSPSPSPANTGQDALESRLKRLEARVEELEHKNGLAPTGSTPK